MYRRFGTSHAFLNNSGRRLPILTDGHPIPEVF